MGCINWTLSQELEFLEGLGTWRSLRQHHPWSRARWLRQYLYVNIGRTDYQWWPLAIKTAYEELIREETGRGCWAKAV